MQAVGLWFLLVSCACVESKSRLCEVGTPFERTCPSNSECDDTHHLCIGATQREACTNLADEMPCSFGTTVITQGLCHDGVCFEARCGDGIISGDEECEGEALGGKTNCTALGFYDSVPLTCNDACGYDRSACTGFCGDGVVQPGNELCDGAPPEASCAGFGYGAGFLDCSFCGADLSDCKRFGWTDPAFAPAGLQAVDGTADDNIYGIGAGALVVRYDGTSMVPLDFSSCGISAGISLVDLDVVAKDDLWIGGSLAGQTVAFHIVGTSCTKTMLGTTSTLNDLSASSTEVWAATSGGIYRYGGSSWSMNDSLAATFIWTSGPGDTYAATTSVLRRWNGSTWSPLALPMTASISALSGAAANDLYVAGYDSSVNPFVFHYTGTWTTTPGDLAGGTIVSLAEAPGLIYAVYEQGDVLVHDGGAWLSLDSPVLSTGGQAHVVPSGRLYVSHANKQALQSFAGTHRHYAQGQVPRATQVAVYRSDLAWAVDTSNNEMWRLIDKTWTEDINVQNAHDVFVDATGTFYEVDGQMGLQRRDSTQWTQLSGALTTATAIAGTAANNIWLIDVPGASTYTLRHWSGSLDATCSTCTSATSLADVWVANATAAFAVGSGGTILSYDGSTWSSEASGTTVSLRALWGWGPADVVAIGPGTVLHFDGATWTSLGFPKPLTLTSVWGTKLGDLFVTTDVGVIYRYDGSHWSPVDSGTSDPIYAIGGANKTVFWFGSTFGREFRLLRAIPWD